MSVVEVIRSVSKIAELVVVILFRIYRCFEVRWFLPLCVGMKARNNEPAILFVGASRRNQDRDTIYLRKDPPSDSAKNRQFVLRNANCIGKLEKSLLVMVI
jgi:hypothetical protein